MSCFPLRLNKLNKNEKKKYITILCIQLLNYTYILLKQGFIIVTRLLDKTSAVNCELSVTEL